MIIQCLYWRSIAIPLVILTPSILNCFAHFDVMVVELYLLFNQILLELLDSKFLLKALSINGRVDFRFVFGLLYDSLAHFILA